MDIIELILQSDGVLRRVSNVHFPLSSLKKYSSIDQHILEQKN